eukprot:COSAG05_NODE_384_length_10492_cov_787.098817_3_plen_89_part_00
MHGLRACGTCLAQVSAESSSASSGSEKIKILLQARPDNPGWYCSNLARSSEYKKNGGTDMPRTAFCVAQGGMRAIRRGRTIVSISTDS